MFCCRAAGEAGGLDVEKWRQCEDLLSWAEPALTITEDVPSLPVHGFEMDIVKLLVCWLWC